ncbi:hypothetical protein [Amycolatopsis sp. NPDC051903]|uniref:hypothetical protein n=1 Tax=Amycolatopsis sp. NPDC051903 TaxID=3363936 RepID=UPI00379ED5CB
MWDLLHAWREWLAGHDTAQLRVFGIAILWWGRLGKTLEFLGGLTVVIDLLGRTRMAAFHTTLRNRRTQLISRLRRWLAPRRKSPVRPARSRLLRPPGLQAFHLVGASATEVFLIVRYFEGGGGPIASTVVVLLSFSLVAYLAGIALGEAGYLITLVLLTALAAATLHLLRPRESPVVTRMVALHTRLRGCRAQLRSRWQGARTPGEEPPSPQPNPPRGDPPAFRAFVIAGTVVMGLFVFVTAHYHYAPPNDPMPVPVLVVLIVVLSPTIGGLVLGGGGYLLGLLLLEGLVVTTLGHLRTRAGLESRLKWIGLAVFVAGFSMDLLSS